MPSLRAGQAGLSAGPVTAKSFIARSVATTARYALGEATYGADSEDAMGRR